ncbi:MAG TPA: helix-turn-helix domain-containing protein [Candidatus Binataceae bacterium]|jgi:excisionase family DNA binding protein|nr:helix-turn-helix domain-containing protein [Candidatus Binataceae bacterium]
MAANPKIRRERQNEGRREALKTVLRATAGEAKVREIFQLLTADEAAEFLGIAEPTVRDMTYRHELPYVRVGKRGVRYRVIDLIGWADSRSVPPQS